MPWMRFSPQVKKNTNTDVGTTVTTNADIDSNNWKQLAIVYDMLSCLWLEALTLERLQALVGSELRQLIETLGGSVPLDATSEITEELADDYHQLFTGSTDSLLPIQSAWMSDPCLTDPASSCDRFYEDVAGYQVETPVPDHLGVQLGFMAHLFTLASEGKRGESYLEVATQFYEEHLDWTSEFLEAVEKKAATDFYRGLARITTFFLDEEQYEPGPA